MSKLKDKQPRTTQISINSARVLAPGNRDTKGMILRRIKQQHGAITDIEADGIGIGGAGAMSYRHADADAEAVLLKIALYLLHNKINGVSLRYNFKSIKTQQHGHTRIPFRTQRL